VPGISLEGDPVRILFITERVPFPLHSGNAILTWHTLDHLAGAHDIDLVAYPSTAREDDGISGRLRTSVLVPPPRRSGRRLRQFASLLTKQGAIEALWRDRQYLEAVSRRLAREAYDAIVVDHLRMGWTLPAVLGGRRSAKVIFRSHNCESDVRRQYAREWGSGIAGLALKLEERKTRAYEERVVRGVDAVIAITPEDAELHRGQGAKRVFVAPPGFDAPAHADDICGAQKVPRTIVLMGSFDYLAKEINALFLLKRVFPRVRACVPDATLLLVGAGPSARLRRVARTIDGVTVTGRVPDAQAIARQCEVFVMPTIVGGGFELKALEAIGLRLPIVATPLGKRGLDLEIGKSILVGAGEEELAAKLVELLSDPGARARQAQSAFAEVALTYTWKSAGARVEAAIRDTCRSA